MARTLGYARCSTNETKQDFNRQKRELKKLGVKDDKYIYWEYESGTKGMLMMWGVFSEMERDIISKRVKSGMDNARAKGRKIGRPKLDKKGLPEKFFKFYDLYKDGQFNITEFAKLMNCSRTTIYKYIQMVQ